MPSPSPRDLIVRFGPFEANLSTQELQKSGTRLRVANQSFQILALLLERPGQLVTRDELRQKLWPSDTFVEYDQGLNAAVNRLRDALGDSAEKPRYIETLPRRGYRFLATTEVVSEDLEETTTPAARSSSSQPVGMPVGDGETVGGNWQLSPGGAIDGNGVRPNEPEDVSDSRDAHLYYRHHLVSRGCSGLGKKTPQ